MSDPRKTLFWAVRVVFRGGGHRVWDLAESVTREEIISLASPDTIHFGDAEGTAVEFRTEEVQYVEWIPEDLAV